MTANGDDPIASWHDRIGSLRKRGRISAAALTVVSRDALDVRRGRPVPPARLSKEERERWDQLVAARRPGWFAGSEAILESYVITVTQMQRLEAALRKDPGLGDRFQKLARTHRQTVALAASLAVKLRLVPSSRLDRRTPQDGELPVVA